MYVCGGAHFWCYGRLFLSLPYPSLSSWTECHGQPRVQNHGHLRYFLDMFTALSIHTALLRHMAFLLARNIQSFQSLYGLVTPKFFLLNFLVISLLVTVGDAASSSSNVKQLPLIIFTNIL